MNDRELRDFQDQEHAIDLAVEIIVERLEAGEVVQSENSSYTYHDFMASEFDDIGEFSEDIAQEVLFGDLLKSRIAEHAPSARVTLFPCGLSILKRYSFDCHSLLKYSETLP